MRRTAVLILVMLALVAPVSGQEPVEAVAMPTDSIERTPNMVLGGLLGGTLGLFLGGAAGYGIETMFVDNCTDYCGLGGIFLGGVVGESLGMAFGVHTGNDQRGSYAGAVVGPLAVAAGSIAAASLIGDQGVPAIAIGIAVPIAQLYASIRGEQAAIRRREGGRE